MNIGNSLSTLFLGDISMQAVEIINQMLRNDLCLCTNFESSNTNSLFRGGHIQVYSSDLKADCLGTVNILVKGISIPPEEAKTLFCARGINNKLKTIDLLRCLNIVDTSNPTVLFLVFICQEDKTHCCFYYVFYHQTLKTLSIYEEVNVFFLRYDVFQPRQSLFIYGILHNEEKYHYFQILNMIDNELQLKYWNQYICDAYFDNCFDSELINGCEKIVESISCYNENNDEDRLATSISIIRNVLIDFLETLYYLSITFLDSRGKINYKIPSIEKDKRNDLITDIMQSPFYAQYDFMDAEKQNDIRYLLDFYKMTLFSLLWELGAAINNIIYSFRGIYGEYHLYTAELGNRCLCFYKTNQYIRCNNMYNLGYNCYLNLKELDIFGNKLNYTPSNYTPYPGLKRLKEFVRGNMAHGKG